MWNEIKKIIIFILASLGFMFIILLLWPDDEEQISEQTAVEQNVDERDTDDRSDNHQSGDHQSVTDGFQTETDTENIKEQISNSGAPDINVDTVSVDTGARSATIMVYVNGSDLESEAGEATEDISEMIASGIGDNVNVIVQTMGTRHWQNYGISSKSAQTYRIEDGEFKLIRDGLGQLDCTDKRTLSEFIDFCKTGYPADRYMFLFWDHGGGPVYGFGYDEWQSETDSLTIAEMAEAFSENDDVHFDIIGMDCCIMASMETCYALAPYCKYALLSEDFESGLGWNYTGWMEELERNPGMATPLLGKRIVDAVIADNESSFGGGSACMGLFNVAASRDLYEAWKAFAYKNEAALLKKNYSKAHKAKGRGFFDNWGYDYSSVTLSDYYISDILALVESIDKNSDEAKKLISALKAEVAYFGHTSDKNELTGLAVSLPYGDYEFYKQLKEVYSDIGLDAEYINWLEGFVSSSGYNDYYDYYGFENNWGGWGDYESEYGCNISNGGSCQYGYDYSSCYDGSCDEDGWIYDYDEEIWYSYEDGELYLYDEDTDTMFYYDEDCDCLYCYDEASDSWEYCE
ncbi:hypothetical protein BXO88_05505 [Oribacterium sp. C9]|uniref:clostripain-related cysteine peptidase n=1 Tax=Oribacterium sp. C9 TaxID=1943579 RepID=UPI00098FC837|nr:clostripain-related cysteine peptidase [Oribacterium sp. C9]OON86997.1 hypothetical protein BXO88_05505 [Oribacterium sp. C9]